MKLEQQVCNLELARKLKSLGVKQESAFYWANGKEIELDEMEIERNREAMTHDQLQMATSFALGDVLWLSWANEWVKITDWKSIGVKNRRWIYRAESMEQVDCAFLNIKEKYLRKNP